MNCAPEPRATASDRCRGLLLGLAAGDTIGGPVRMAVRLAESLVERGQFDPEDILERYLKWSREGAFDTGPVTADVLSLIESGVQPEQAVRDVHQQAGGRTAGVAPAHRSAPLALAHYLDEDALLAAARREASLTHHDPVAGDVAAAVVLLCRRLVLGEPWAVGLEAARAVGTKAARAVGAKPCTLSRRGYAPEVFEAALHWLDRSDTFAEALDRSVEFAGAANYCPVLVGSIGGARWGASAVTGLDHVEASLRGRLEALAGDFGWGGT